VAAQVTGIACNVADADAVAAAFAQLKADGYRPDVVINNACVPILCHIRPYLVAAASNRRTAWFVQWYRGCWQHRKGD
jgi:NAD(P)-dependent dehydrogenase (short-subunit alcohol dehydrogenase family)